ncbi:MAG TPA: DUF3313 family protein [Tepidisphaeraceae bacterium]|jgi:hypothetical protein|nr:DUF3313 family protein [Tepidisphaeraceae bacterium]HEV8606292.1 DUF3313 family protein [Tepidisphaeraceae bacterium]
MHQYHQTRLLAFALLAAALLAGCRAKPAPSAGFADPELMKYDASLPFNKFWRKPDVDWKHYDTLYIADVSTSYMLAMTDWQKGERKEEIERDVHTIGIYTRDALKKAFRDDPRHRFQVVDAPTEQPQALVFEMALIELVPSKVALNALGYAPFGVGLGISAVRGAANDKSTVAFEARLRDAATGDILMLAADREAEQAAIIDLRAFKWYTHAHAIIDGWSRQWVRVIEQKPGEKIKDMDTFRLLPW